MIFISTPYSHKYKEVVEERVKIVAYYTAYLLGIGEIPISPVLLGHKIREHVNLPGNFDTWNELCFSYLRKSNEMHILMQDGWIQSKGVDAEIDFARENNIAIRYIEFFQPVPNGTYAFKENDALKKKEKHFLKIQSLKEEIANRDKYK